MVVTVLSWVGSMKMDSIDTEMTLRTIDTLRLKGDAGRQASSAYLRERGPYDVMSMFQRVTQP